MVPTLDFGRHRREIILGVFLLAVVIVFLYRQAGPGPVAGAANVTLVSGPPSAVSRALSQIASVKLPNVMLDRLREEPAPYDPSQRNIFRFGNIPPPPDPQELARIEAARKAAEEARRAAIEAEQRRQAEELARQQAQPPIDPATGLPVGMVPPPPPVPTPPAITLRYSGYLGSPTQRVAVLYSGEDLVLARVGEVVERQFRVLDIGYDWVKIGYVDPQFEDQYQKLGMGP